MAFSDVLNSDNLNQLFQNPAMLAGLQMLAASGPQQGNPGFGARMGQALGGTATQLQQIQHSQQLNAYRQQMAQLQAQQMQLAQAKAQQQAELQQRQQAAFQDPAVLQQMGPLAKLLAQAGLDPTTVLRAQSGDNLQAHRQASLAQQAAQFDERQARIGAGGGSSGPRTPAPRSFVDEPLGDDMYQRHQYDPATGGYQAFGKPFNKHSTRTPKAPATPADAAVDSILNAEPPAAGPDLGSLPGGGGLQQYAPQPQQPVGVMPMTAAGAVPGAAQKPKAAATQAQYPNAPAVGTVRKGYRYNGGNPADPASWSKA